MYLRKLFVIVIFLISFMPFVFISCKQNADTTSRLVPETESSDSTDNPEPSDETDSSTPLDKPDTPVLPPEEKTDIDGQTYLVTTYPSFKKDDIYVTIQNIEENRIAEYLEFLTDASGKYHAYKNGLENTDSRLDFTYTSTNGFYNDGITRGYLFKDSSGIIYAAKSNLHRKNGSGFFTEWTNGNLTLLPMKDGSFTGSNLDGNQFTGNWSNKDGIIFFDFENSDEDFTFYYISDGHLYYDVFIFQKVSSLGKEPNLIIEDGIVYANIKQPTFSEGDIYAYKKEKNGITTILYYKFAYTRYLGYGYYIYEYSNGICKDYSKDNSTSWSFSPSKPTNTLWTKDYSQFLPIIETQTGKKYLADTFIQLQNSSIYEKFRIPANYDFDVDGYIEFHKDGTITGDDAYGNITGSFENVDGIITLTLNRIMVDGSNYTQDITAIFSKEGLYFGLNEFKEAESIGGELLELIENVVYNEAKTKIVRVHGDGSEGFTILDSVTEICNKAFYNCECLERIEIPDSVEKIGDYAFSGCKSLKSIKLPKSLKTLGYYGVFESCYSLETLDFPASVTYICSLDNCPLKSITVQPGNEIYYSKDDVLFMRGKYISMGEYNKVYDNTGIGLVKYPIEKEQSSYSIPKEITYIAADAFSGCKNLETITIPDTMTSISPGAFSGCYSLKTINIPNSVIAIEYEAFSFCYALTSIVIPDSVTFIGNNVFWCCSSLEDIVIPDSVTQIGGKSPFESSNNKTDSPINYTDSPINDTCSTFASCSKLKTIKLPKTLTELNGEMFEECKALENITFPENLKIIGSGIFRECINLKELNLPDSVTSIGRDAFYKCESLESINIPKALTEIGARVFSGCLSLKKIELPDTVISIGENAFYNCTSLENVNIRNTVTSIGENAFYNCTSLKNINIPSTLTSIYEGTFQSCSAIEKIIIPSSVIYIGKKAFNGCSSLTCVEFEDSESEWKRGWAGDKSIHFSDPQLNSELLARNSDYYDYSWFKTIE